MFVFMVMTLVSCGSDDEPNNPSSDKVYSATVSIAGVNAYIDLNDELKLEIIRDGGTFVGPNYQAKERLRLVPDAARLIYVSDAKSLESIKSIPTSGWSSTCYLNHHFIDGGYIGEYTSRDGVLVYIKMWITFTRNASGEFSSVSINWQYLK